MKEEYEEISMLDDPVEGILDPGISMLQSLEGAIDEKCRACTRRLLDAKHNLLETWELSERFVRLSTTQLDPDDLLPKSICPECFQRLQDVDNFQKSCIASYTLLLQHTANNLKQDSSGSDGLPIDPIEDSGSNRPKLLEFEEVVVSDIKSEDVKSEQPILIDSEDETEKVIANQKFDEIDMSPKKMKVRRQPSRKRQTKTKKVSYEDGDESTLYTCEKCGSTFDSEIHYKGHLRKHEGKKPYPCQKCTREYEKISLYEQHMEIEHSGDQPPKYQCTVEGCDKKYRTQPALNKHLNIHSNTLPRERKRVVCETCGKCVLTSNIRQHEMMHKGLAPYSCDQCPKKFASSIKLERHKLVHLNIKPHTCQLCGLKMRSQKDVDWHMRMHNRQRRHQCELCELSFFTKDNLLRHVRGVHYGIKDFHCTYCDQSFTQSTSLKCHLMLHTGERPYKCPYCEKGFIQKCKMNKHIKIHKEKGDQPVSNISTEVENISTEAENIATGVGNVAAEAENDFKNFECEICGLKTTFRERRSHMSEHRREKRHPCEICNMDFITHRVLLNHIKIVHERIKSYACQYCDKKFGKATTLRNHTMRHTGERPLQCLHCEKRFITRFALQYHEKKRERDIAQGKIPCSKNGPTTESKAKSKRKRKSSNRITILTAPISQTYMPQTDVSQTDRPPTDRQPTTSYNQDETMLV